MALISVNLRKRKLANGNYSLYLDMYNCGTRKTETLPLILTKDSASNRDTMKLAKRIQSQRLIELQNNYFGVVPEFKKRKDFVAYFQTFVNKKELNDTYYCTYLWLKDFTKGGVEISAIDEKWLESFKEFLLTKVSPNSAATYFSKIKHVMKEAKREKILLDNPSENVKSLKYTDAQRIYLTLNEIQKLSDNECKLPEVKRAFLFSCYTGLRFSDIRELTWNQIQNNELRFRQKKTGEFEYFPLHPTAISLLYNNVNNTIPLPTNKVFSIPQRCHTNVILKEWSKSAKIDKDITQHTARHTYATLLLTNGSDIYTVMKLLGHKNIVNTQRYAKLIDEKRKQAVDKLPAIEF